MTSWPRTYDWLQRSLLVLTVYESGPMYHDMGPSLWYHTWFPCPTDPLCSAHPCLSPPYLLQRWIISLSPYFSPLKTVVELDPSHTYTCTHAIIQKVGSLFTLASFTYHVALGISLCLSRLGSSFLFGAEWSSIVWMDSCPPTPVYTCIHIQKDEFSWQIV